MKKYIIITVIVTAIITTGIILTIVNVQKNNKIEECVVKYNETALEAEMLNNKVENTVVVSNDIESQNEVVENIIIEDEEIIENKVEIVTEDTVINEEEKEEVIEEPKAQYVEGNEYVGYIRIGKFNVDAPIFKYSNTVTLNISTAVAYGTLNEVGNTVIFGHAYQNYPFEKISQLENGDKITIVDLADKEFVYEVYDKKVIESNDATYMIRNTNGAKEITLQTGHSDPTKRLIVIAKEVN